MVSEIEIEKSIQDAVAVLKSGGVVVFPTETAYGLAADATNDRAVKRVAAIKGREAWKTSPLIVADRVMAEKFADISPKLSELADRFWPGALTIIARVQTHPNPLFDRELRVERPLLRGGKSDASPLHKGGLRGVLSSSVVRDGTIAIRVSSNPVARALSKGICAPITATSANLAGEKECYRIEDVKAKFASQALHPDFYLDVGELEINPPSTIVREVNGKIEVLRQGGIKATSPCPSLGRRGVFPRAKKSYSQNWLVDESVLEIIINAAKLKPGDAVLEIGPGTGALTQALVDAGARVTAVEADPDLILLLREKFGDRISLIHGDALSFSSTFPPSHLSTYSLISNIPYNLTSDILRHFLTALHKPDRMILMLQREVADRVTAKPPDMSLLSVVCQLYARCEKVANVPRGAFRPVPKVDSAIVRLDLIKEGSDQERENIIRTAKAGFSSPRKQLHGNLSRVFAIPPERVKQTLARLGLDPKARAEALNLDNWTALTHKLNESG